MEENKWKMAVSISGEERREWRHSSCMYSMHDPVTDKATSRHRWGARYPDLHDEWGPIAGPKET